MATYIQQITTNLILANIKQQYTLPDGTTLNFLFYQNFLSQRIGFNLEISGYVFNSVNMNLAPNMIAPLGFLGSLYIQGDFPTIASIDKTSILYFAK